MYKLILLKLNVPFMKQNQFVCEFYTKPFLLPFNLTRQLMHVWLCGQFTARCLDLAQIWYMETDMPYV